MSQVTIDSDKAPSSEGWSFRPALALATVVYLEGSKIRRRALLT